MSADTFCSYCGANTNPTYSDHREETCPKKPPIEPPASGNENCARCNQPRFTCVCTSEELAQATQSVSDEPPLGEPRPAPVRVFNKTTGQDDCFESWEAYLDATQDWRTACQHSFEVLNKFAHLFKGNPNAYALYDGKKYETIKRCDDWPDAWERHLRGEYPSLLSIPILPDGSCYFAGLDIDRHEGCTFPLLDHAALAKRVSELNLPLVVWQSKNGKGGYAGIFFKDQKGCDAAAARRVLAHYRERLQIQGAEEIFPKQTGIDEHRAGNGFNLPYFGNERIAFGKNGEELSIEQFLALAYERQTWGKLFEQQFPPNADSASTKGKEYGPLPVDTIRRLCAEKIAELPLLLEGDRHHGLVRITYFVAMAFAAKALTESEAELKRKIWAAYADGWTESGKHWDLSRQALDKKSATETWDDGLRKPLEILDPEKEAAESLAYVDAKLDGDDDLDLAAKKELIRHAARISRSDLALRKKRLRQKLDLSPKDLEVVLAAEHAPANSRPQPTTPEHDTIEQVLAEFGKQGEEIGRFFVVDNYGDKCVVASLEADPHPAMRKRIALGIQSFDNFRKRFDNIRILLGQDRMGSPIIKGKGTGWLNHPERRQFERIVYAPGDDLGPKIRNLWQGFAVESKQGDCSLFLDFVRDVICSGNEEHFQFLVGWMAYAVQHPSEQGYACPVLRGLEGIGKNFFADAFGYLWRKHYLPLTHAEHVGGRFNHHLWDCSVLFANEAFFAGDHQREAMIKTYVTDSTLTIEQKFVNIITVPNLLHVIIASNNPWVVRATSDARRFFVLDVSDCQRNKTAYFGAIKKQLENGGYEAFLHHLLTMKLSNFNPRLVPHTDALRDQMVLSLTGVEAVWFECLLSARVPGRWLEQGRSVELRASEFLTWARKQHPSARTITEKALMDLLGNNPRVQRKPMGFQDGRKPNGGPRYRVVPPLTQARKKWDEVRFVWQWPKTTLVEEAECWEPFEPKD